MTPIFQSSTFVQSSPGEHQGYEYARTGNPTRTALEANLAALGGSRHGICFSSGSAAIDAVVRLLRAGDHVVASDDLYGGTYRLFTNVFARFGMEFSFVDMASPEAVEEVISPATKSIWVETPTNPLMKIVDIARLSELGRPPEPWWWWTTPSPRHSCSDPWNWAPIWWCTASPNTRGVIPTLSAAPC